MISDEQWLDLAIDEAEKAFNKDEVPVGCIIILDDVVIAKAHNLKESTKDTLAHAELLAIKDAQRAMNDWRLSDCVMYSTLEPCIMCAGAILHSRLKKLVFGAKDLKWGGCGTKLDVFKKGLFNHHLDVQYQETKECSEILTAFFKNKRS
jgi:tRNA(adenine34) deaminase